MMMMMAKPRTDLPASPGATCVIDCLRGVWIGPDQDPGVNLVYGIPTQPVIMWTLGFISCRACTCRKGVFGPNLTFVGSRESGYC